MRRNLDCNGIDHLIARREFLWGSAAGAIGLGTLTSPLNAARLQQQQKRVLQIYLQGGVSQLESWDPKPGTQYGGPFQAIPTSVPGIHISELLPHTASRMHLLSLVRSINSKIGDHRQGMLFMEKGRRAGDYPYFGSVVSKYLAPTDAELPGYIHISKRGIVDSTAAFLGARHAELKLLGDQAPANLVSPKSIDEPADEARQRLRVHFDRRFSQQRSRALTDVYNSSFEQAEKLMKRKAMFEGTVSEQDLDRYGRHDFGRHCILARDLLENGATCVKVTHHGYDTHAENFNFHLEQLGEFDKTFSMLLDDIHDRGMLDSTLVIVYSEMGRTPKINTKYGRDHWGTAWSVAMGGCGIQPAAVIGKTNDEGTEVVEREVDGGHLFHTYLSALGLDSTTDHDVAGKSIPIGDPAAAPIEELLA
ncbi:DUF1501 domain-containing protein [Planctomycetes bacterium TBK1r]|uniref:DUF1501 domain-containing protein n=1 Tax=Stieleria magnilauensis TaxID=2527963 RepID=A0ABX5XTS2_9BACT|nr:hypothetical protein TBK1r_33000 [Planctomycetes bacterium TBK1r]